MCYYSRSDPIRHLQSCHCLPTPGFDRNQCVHFFSHPFQQILSHLYNQSAQSILSFINYNNDIKTPPTVSHRQTCRWSCVHRAVPIVKDRANAVSSPPIFFFMWAILRNYDFVQIMVHLTRGFVHDQRSIHFPKRRCSTTASHFVV